MKEGSTLIMKAQDNEVDLCCNFICPHNNKANIEILMKCMPGVCDKFDTPKKTCNSYMNNIPPQLYFPLNKVRSLIKKFKPGETSPEEAFALLAKIKFEIEDNKMINDFNTINGTIGCYPLILAMISGFSLIMYFIAR